MPWRLDGPGAVAYGVDGILSGVLEVLEVLEV